MSENRKEPTSSANDQVFGALVKAAGGPRVQLPAQDPSAAEEARAAYLRAVRRRDLTRSYARQMRPRKFVAFLVGAILALGGGASIYLFHDLPEITDSSPYRQPCVISGTLMTRSPTGGGWVRLAGESTLPAGAVVVVPAGDPVRIEFGLGGLVVEGRPGTRLFIRKGRRTPIEVLSGEVTCELRANQDETMVGLPREREVAFARGESHRDGFRLVLTEQGARATLLVDVVLGQHVGQVRIERGSAVIRQGSRAMRRGLVTGACALCRGTAVQLWTPEELGTRGWPRGEGWSGAHWRVRPAGAVRSAPELATGLPLRGVSADTIEDLRRLATGTTPDPVTIDEQRAAIASLGSLDSADAIAALLALGDPGGSAQAGELEDSYLRALMRFSDPEVNRRLLRALGEPASGSPGLLTRAEIAYVLARRHRETDEFRAQVADLLGNSESGTPARVWCLAATVWLRVEGHEEAVRELGAIGAAPPAGAGGDSAQLAAIAALEEMAVSSSLGTQGSRQACLALVGILTAARAPVALAAEAALVVVTGKSVEAPVGAAPGPAGRAGLWRELVAAPR